MSLDIASQYWTVLSKATSTVDWKYLSTPQADLVLGRTVRQIGRDNAWTIMQEDSRRSVTYEELGRLNMPVLIVGGEKSPASFGAILNVIEPCLKNPVRVTIPNASHTMNRINPTAFKSAVVQFLSTH